MSNQFHSPAAFRHVSLATSVECISWENICRWRSSATTLWKESWLTNDIPAVIKEEWCVRMYWVCISTDDINNLFVLEQLWFLECKGRSLNGGTAIWYKQRAEAQTLTKLDKFHSILTMNADIQLFLTHEAWNEWTELELSEQSTQRWLEMKQPFDTITANRKWGMLESKSSYPLQFSNSSWTKWYWSWQTKEKTIPVRTGGQVRKSKYRFLLLCYRVGNNPPTLFEQVLKV